jgi:hypothetical protein
MLWLGTETARMGATPPSGSWTRPIVGTVVLFVAAAALICLAFGSTKRVPAARVLPDGTVVCPQCGDAKQHRGAEFRARCLTCDCRSAVPRKVWRTLPFPDLGALGETRADRKMMRCHRPLNGAQILFVCLTIVLAMPLGIALRIPPHLLLVIGIPAAWYAGGKWPQRRRQRWCPTCGKALSGPLVAHCPRCSASLASTLADRPPRAR